MKKFLLPFSVLLLSTLFLHKANAQVRYVDASRPSSGAGTSWATAFKTLAEAVEAANANGIIHEIYVAKGTYYPTGSSQNSTNRDSAFTIKRGGFEIYGGYPNGGGTRNLANNPTILSGDIATANIHSDNSYHIMVIAGLSSVADSVIVDGFSFQRGYANNGGSKGYSGEAIGKDRAGALAVWGCDNGKKLSIRNCIFSANLASDAGGAVFVNASSPLFVNCLFSGNLADYGGGICLAANSPASIEHCTIAGNNAPFNGGGIRNSASNPIITNTIVYGNNNGISNNSATPVISFSVVQGIGSTNPQFVNAAGFNDAPSTGGNYQLSSTSPCINAGSNAAIPTGIAGDLTGNLRTIGCTTDMGAYEYLTPSNLPVINSSNIANVTLCHAASHSYTVSASNATGYQWQVNTGSGYTNLANSTPYSGTTTSTLTINPATFALNGYKYRCVVSGCLPATISAEATLTVLPAALNLYVDASRVGSGNGATWGTAYKTLREALIAAHECPASQVSIYVAQGTYYPTGTQSATDRDEAFAISKGFIKIYGGYSSGGSNRDITAYPTILSGDIGTASNTADNSYHILVIAGLSAGADSVVLEGFTFTRGNADGTSSKTYNGQEVGRDGGGAIAMRGNANAGKLSLRQCSFTNNNSFYNGGAIMILSSSPTLNNCSFSGNNSRHGGALYNDQSNPVLNNCAFISNTASINGGAINNTDNSQPRFNVCSFTANQAAGTGGAIYNTNNIVLQVNQCSFLGNTAVGNGGAINNLEGLTTISNSGFSNNTTQQEGGAIANNSQLTINNSQFMGNTAVFYGGAMVNSGNLAVTNCLFSGNVAASGSSLRLNSSLSQLFVNCTIAGNRATTNGIVYNSSSAAPSFKNTIIYGNSHGMYSNSGPGFQYTNCIIQGGSGGGALDSNPYFENPFPPATAPIIGGNYRLINCSPAVNTGDNASLPAGVTTDLDGSLRIYETIVDMGAFEFQSAKTPAPAIIDHPVNATVCPGGSVSFSASASNGGSYQWQVDMGSGFINVPAGAPYSGTATLTINPVTVPMEGYRFRSIVTGTCNRMAISNPATLHLLPVPAITSQPVNVSGCSNSGISITMAASDVTTYQWQVNPGSGFVNVPASSLYSGSGTNTLTINNPTLSMSGFTYRCIASGTCSPAVTTNNATLFVYPPILYVDGGKAGSGTGNSWGTAFKTVQEALSLAHNCSAITQVWIKEGTYRPTAYPLGSTGGSTAEDYAFTLRNGLAIYGGFAGTETDTSQRVSGHTTILTGVDGQTTNHILIGVNINNTARLNGLTIGNAVNFNSGSITISGISIDRRSGTGLYNNASSPVLINCIFSNNINQQGNGGAIFNASSSPSLIGCSFTGNIAHQGSGAAIYNTTLSNPAITNCYFDGNRSYNAGGAVYNDASSPIFSNCSFSNNTAGLGGGIFNNNSSPAISYCKFTVNTAGSGGAVTNYGGSPVITNCIFSSNRANSMYGGGIYNSSALSVITNCIFFGNTGPDYGGGFFNQGLAATLINCTFSKNTADYGGGVANNSGTTTLKNCILWDNSSNTFMPEIYNIATVVVNYSIVQGSGVFSGTGNLNIDPVFNSGSNAIGADGIWGTADDGLRPTVCSPVIEAGNNADIPAGITTDVAGSLRVFGTKADMGAYEVQATRATLTTISVSPSNAVTCHGSSTASFSITASNATGYQWQVNDGSGFVNVPNTAAYTGGTTNTLNINAATTPMNGFTFKCIASGICSPAVTSGPATLTVNPLPVIGIIVSPLASICAGTPVTLSGTGAASYSWSGGITNATPFIASATATYSVTGTDINGCSNTASQTITVSTNTSLSPATTSTITIADVTANNGIITNGNCGLVARVIPNGSTPVSGSIDARVWVENVQPTVNGKPYVKRHYEITPAANAANATARITLYFLQQEFDASNSYPYNGPDLPMYPDDYSGKNNLRIIKYGGKSNDGSGVPLSYPVPGVSIDPLENDIVWNSVNNYWEVSFNVTGFSGFIVANNEPVILPLSDILLEGSVNNNNARLNWKLSQAFDGNRYELQVGTGNNLFTTIYTQTGNALNTQFTYTDVSPVPGNRFYRIKQTDKSGAVNYSNVIVLKITGKANMVQVYPNPVARGGQLHLQAANGFIIHNWQIETAAGQRIMQQQNVQISGTAELTMPAILAPGVYYLVLNGSGEGTRVKILVK
ncbi:MAG: choice-of-anchor Q domain-containing protein [Bacteroidota bacterium]